MSAPVITAITLLAQGQGQNYLPKQSVVEVEVQFTTTGNIPATLTAQISIDSGSTWHACTLHGDADGTNVIPPSGANSAMILIDVYQTWLAQSLTPGNYGGVRVKVTASAGGLTSATYEQSSLTCTVKSFRPVLSSLTAPNWIGQSQAYAAPVTVFSSDDSGSGLTNLPDDPNTHLYRFSTDAGDLGPAGTATFFAYTHNAQVNIATSSNGAVTIYFRVYDKFYNASDVASVTTNLQLTSPRDCVVKLQAANAETDYGGIEVNPSTGAFTPNRFLRLYLSCTSTPGIPLYYQILSTSNLEAGAPVGVTYPLVGNPSKDVMMSTNPGSPTSQNFNTDVPCTISVKFTDAAGNFTVVNKTIRLNTRIYKTAHSPLRHAQGSYAPRLHFVSSGGADVNVPQEMILDKNPVRRWREIFYPPTHGYPLDVEGNLDLAAVAADASLKAMISTANYDPVLITVTDNGFGNPPTITPILDDDGRYVTTNWTVDGSKDYHNMESSSSGTLRYWVIDNTGYGDFSLEFEYFDLDGTIFGPPFNPQSSYRGDVLVVYDATDGGAIASSGTDAFGLPTYTLTNSTLLKPLFAFAGTGANVVDLMTGVTVGATANGEFISQAIVNTPKILLMLFTDSNGTASGFKLKAGPRHDRIWKNYEVDEINGEIWVHLHESLSDNQVRGSSDLTVKRMYYDYIPNPVSFELESGRITFQSAQSGRVTADFSFYDSNTVLTNTFVASEDDFVDYSEAPVYVVPGGSVECPYNNKLNLFEVNGNGRLVRHFAWDKDRGVLTITPSGFIAANRRISSDYFHHTYTRLTSDQFGDLVFRDKILVADVVPNFPDYTWADVKVVNEGNTVLKDMQIKFVPRGYDTDGDGNVTLTGNNIVDQVLDINRPWDIQLGTKDETYTKMAMAIAPDYIWPRNCPKLGGDGLTGNSGAGAIWSTWADKVYGDLAARQTAFGRVVWILGGSSGTGYPSAITAGPKRCSLEAQGKYYASLVI